MPLADYIKQYHENPIGYEGWDHRAFSWVSSLIVAAVSLVLCIFSFCKSTSGAQGLRSFTGSMFWSGLTLGIAMKLLDDIYDNGGVIGTNWQGTESLYMYFWAAAMVSTSLAMAGMIHTAVVPVASGAQQCNEAVGGILTAIAYLAGLAIAIYDVYTFRAEGKINDAQRALVLWGFAASVISIVVNILCFFGLGGEGCCHLQRILMMVGNVAMGLGFVLIAFSPEECRKNGEAREGCPWPEEFNQNQMFHILQFVAVVFISLSVFCQSDDARKYTPVSAHGPTDTHIATAPAPSKQEPPGMTGLFACCNRRSAGPPAGATMPLAHGH